MTVRGVVALHGGGEFGPADGPFLRAVLAASASTRVERDRACGGPARGADGALRIVLLPTAAAASRPDLAVANGRAALAGVGAELGLSMRIESADVLTRKEADDPVAAGRLAGADLVYIPGGDPGHLLEVLEASLAWRSMLAAYARGALLAGASAGAMAFGGWSWTPSGPRRALGLVPDLAVLPHHDDIRLQRWAAEVAAAAGDEAHRLGWLGLDEQTGVVSSGPAADSAFVRWHVTGVGSARWFRPGSAEAGAGPEAVGRDGDVLELPT